VRVDLGKFALSGIETRLGNDIVAGVQLALSHHVLKLRNGGGQLAKPRFLDESWAAATPCASYDVVLDPGTQALIEREASSRGTTTSRVAVEAVLAFLASLDMAGSQA
jgi:hypothetical protein